MAQFVRVRSAVRSDPQHEFSVSTVEYEANKGLYSRVSKGVDDEAFPPVYVELKPSK